MGGTPARGCLTGTCVYVVLAGKQFLFVCIARSTASVLPANSVHVTSDAVIALDIFEIGVTSIRWRKWTVTVHGRSYC